MRNSVQDGGNTSEMTFTKCVPFLTSVNAECHGSITSEQVVIRKQGRPQKLLLFQQFLRALLIGIIQMQMPPDTSKDVVLNSKLFLNYSKFLSERFCQYGLVISCWPFKIIIATLVNSELSFLETDLQQKREEGVSESSAERLLVGKASTHSENCEHRDISVCINKHLQENQQTPLGLVVLLEKGFAATSRQLLLDPSHIWNCLSLWLNIIHQRCLALSPLATFNQNRASSH